MSGLEDISGDNLFAKEEASGILRILGRVGVQGDYEFVERTYISTANGHVLQNEERIFYPNSVVDACMIHSGIYLLCYFGKWREQAKQTLRFFEKVEAIAKQPTLTLLPNPSTPYKEKAG